MPKPGEHKTVQARILQYAQECGWTFVPRAEAERRRGFDAAATTPEARARPATPYFGDLLHVKVREFKPKYQEAEGALIGRLLRLTRISPATAISSLTCTIRGNFSRRRRTGNST